MTLAEFHAVVRGFAKSRGAAVDATPAEADYFAALAAFEAAGLA